MSFALEKKLVIALSSSALFDLTESDEIFRNEGDSKYRQWMSDRADEPLPPGRAFNFIRKFLALNRGAPAGEEPVEVVLLSRNDPEAGIRIFRSIRHYGLDIIRAAFLDGRSPYPYISAFNASLFLSANYGDVVEAVDAGYPAGYILSAGYPEQPQQPQQPQQDEELKVAFDFDGVIADDQAERVYRSDGGLEAFEKAEERNAAIPLDPGPLKDFFQKLSALQAGQREQGRGSAPRLRIAIITARNAPAHERLINTLKSWGIYTDEVFFLGGVEKSRILEVMRPDLFLDDQRGHLEPAGSFTACVHVPFGIANRSDK
jgi:5'-nucleotidase